MDGRPVAIYLLVNVLNIYADDADDVDDVDDVDNVDDVNDVSDVGDADLAKTLLPTVGLEELCRQASRGCRYCQVFVDVANIYQSRWKGLTEAAQSLVLF
jgi:hypothetical protein